MFEEAAEREGVRYGSLVVEMDRTGKYPWGHSSVATAPLASRGRAGPNRLVVRNNALLVAGSKTLHHLPRKLVPPMDRAYTQKFFGWHNSQFQYGQAKCFRLAYRALAVPRIVNARQFVGSHPRHSSVSKVLDNGLVGLVRAIEHGAVMV